MIEDYHVRNVLRELGRCLAIFPNVHTLKLDHTISTVPLDQAITYGFGRHKSFPQIRAITLRPNCDSLLRYGYVPSARYIYFIGPKERQPEAGLLGLGACCPLLENIRLCVPSNIAVLPIFFTSYSLSADNCNPTATHPSSRPTIPEHQRTHIAIHIWD